MNKRNLKKLLIVVCIVIVILAIILLAVNKKTQKNEQPKITDTPNLGGGEKTLRDKTISFKEYRDNKVCLQQYIDMLNTENSRYFSRNEDGEFEKTVDESEIKQNIIDLLSKNYIEKNRINISNLYDYIDTTEEKMIILPINIEKLAEQDGVTSYKVKALLISNELDESEEVYFVTTIDINNTIFQVEPIKTSKELKDYTNSNISSIEKNVNNEFMSQDVTGETKAREYFSLYKYLLIVRPDIAYDFLDEEYKEKRFDDIEEFEEYAQNIKPKIRKIRIDKYEVNSDNEDFEQYICQDQFGDIYIFNEISTLNFKVILDEYTIDIPQFIDTYDNAKTQEKVFLNIEKIRQALNSKDYNYVYSKLNNAFKNNNFGSVSEFESYLSSNLPEFIKIDYNDFSNEGETYIYNLGITDLMKNKGNNTVNMQVIMKLKENRDFEMSFSIK